MNQFNNEISPEVKEKVKKNNLYIALFSITMFFGGLLSAYVVKSADGFWVYFTLPSSFWISTVLILLSSVTLYLALSFAKKNNKKQVKLQVTLTLLFGLGFTYFQFGGWKEMFERTNMFISPTVNNEGQYGKLYALRFNGDEVYFDGETFKINGENVSPDVDAQIVSFGEYLYNSALKNDFSDIDTTSFILVDKLSGSHVKDLSSLSVSSKRDIMAFASTVYRKIGVFFIKGEYGTDFYLTFNNKKVDYQNGLFSIDGVPFDSNQEQMLVENQNVNAQFVYLLSALHLAHLIGGLIYLMVLLSKSYKGVYDANNHLQLKLGGIYWHYLDLLWIILFLFLQFIH